MLLRRNVRSASGFRPGAWGATRSALLGAALAVAGTACVEPFGGSSIEVTFDPTVQTPTPEGGTPEFGRPPPNTYYAFYSVDLEYELDADGNVVTDGEGNPVVLSSYAFEVERFEIRPLINMSSPCFIESDETRFPGLHVTQEANKLREQTGITDPMNPLPGTPENDVTDVLTSDVRMAVLPALQNNVRAVVAFSEAQPPGVHDEFQVAAEDECVEDAPGVDPTLIPPPNCIGSESNARRLELCEQYWERYPAEYEGSDKVFTLPLNGEWRGAVTGNNPKNQGFLGGVHFYCSAALEEFDVFLMNWQYKDVDGNGQPDYPDGTEESKKSVIGYHYMEGTPVVKTRGVVNVPLANRVFTITGEASIISSLAEDDVHF